MSLLIAVIIMTKNEALNIERCLTHTRDFAQVFVVDSGSGDDTVTIAQRNGATVVPFIWNGQYPKKKQWCLDNLPVTQPWVLFLDADEYPTPELLLELQALTQQDDAADGYYIRAHVSHKGRLMRYGRKHCKLALCRVGKAAFPVVDDLQAPGGWEVEGHYQPVVDGRVERLSAYLVHDDLKPARAWYDRHDNYATWSAYMQHNQGLRFSEQAEPPPRRIIKALLHHLPARPVLAFLDSFVFCRGFLDGQVGFAYARDRARYYAAIDAAYRDLRHAVKAAAQPVAVPIIPASSAEAGD